MDLCCFMAPRDRPPTSRRAPSSMRFTTPGGAAGPQPIFSCLIPDAIGAGASSKPSGGLRTHFACYGYKDQVRAQHLLLEKIGITHLKLVLGTSMGGMYQSEATEITATVAYSPLIFVTTGSTTLADGAEPFPAGALASGLLAVCWAPIVTIAKMK